MLRAEAKGGVSNPLGPGDSSPLRRRSPVLLLALGFNLSAIAMFSVVHVLGEALRTGQIVEPVRYGLGAGICAILLAVDLVGILKRRQQCALGLQRQTPKNLVFRLGSWVGPLLWGLDTGLAVTTIRMAALTWAAVALTALSLGPWWSGIAYGLGFSVPLTIAVLGPRWRGGTGPASDPQWIPRLLMRGRHVLRLICVVVLLCAICSVAAASVIAAQTGVGAK
jgi:hypothetical protein